RARCPRAPARPRHGRVRRGRRPQGVPLFQRHPRQHRRDPHRPLTGSRPMRTYRVVAHNTATASRNKIHDDEVARRYGFGGGLGPGVDVYAYMTRVPAEAWGGDWLARGSLRARFLTPVYDGDEVEVVPGEPEVTPVGRTGGLTVRNGAGARCGGGG